MLATAVLEMRSVHDLRKVSNGMRDPGSGTTAISISTHLFFCVKYGMMHKHADHNSSTKTESLFLHLRRLFRSFLSSFVSVMACGGLDLRTYIGRNAGLASDNNLVLSPQLIRLQHQRIRTPKTNHEAESVKVRQNLHFLGRQ